MEHERAIEVLPTHATADTLARLRSLGFDYLSLGIQSFDDGMLRHLGRLNTAEENRAALARSVRAFACVNADLIFDVAFAAPQVFLTDFERCCRAGVDQISTYPLMHFGYTPFGKAAHTPRAEHALLRRTCELAERLGYERRSVWTFTRVGGPLYASIARELYLGCGAGAATFTGEDFLVNHFGLARYEQALAAGRLPLARRAHLGPLRAALYYAFWQLYAPGIDLVRFRRMFPGAGTVTPFLDVLRRLGYLELRDERLHLTERGFDRYHDLERWVTYHLIEPLWEEMLEEHPPGEHPRRRRDAASGAIRRRHRAARARARAVAPHRRSARIGRRPRYFEGKETPMRTFIRCALLAALAAAVLPLGSTAVGSTGSLSITKDTVLTEDHRGTISIDADGVTLDCAGHRVVGSGYDLATGVGDFAGISLRGRSDITVKGCTITGFKVGVIAWGATG